MARNTASKVKAVHFTMPKMSAYERRDIEAKEKERQKVQFEKDYGFGAAKYKYSGQNNICSDWQREMVEQSEGQGTDHWPSYGMSEAERNMILRKPHGYGAAHKKDGYLRTTGKGHRIGKRR